MQSVYESALVGDGYEARSESDFSIAHKMAIRLASLTPLDFAA